MTPDERKKLAEWLGWEFLPDAESESLRIGKAMTEGGENLSLINAAGDVCAVVNKKWLFWQPDQDANQTRLLLERVAELGQGSTLAIYLSDDDLVERGNTYGCSCSPNWDEAFRILNSTPAQICQATLTLIKQEAKTE